MTTYYRIVTADQIVSVYIDRIAMKLYITSLVETDVSFTFTVTQA